MSLGNAVSAIKLIKELLYHYGKNSFSEDHNNGNSVQLRLNIAEFEHLEELTICEGRTSGDRFKELVPFYALVDWHDSFMGGSQSLKRLRF